MKHLFKHIQASFRRRSGNALAEFTVTTAMMATLAATAAPKLSDGSAGNSMMSIKESADLQREVQQLSRQRDVIKEEIFELLVAQNELLMQNMSNSQLQNRSLDYSTTFTDLAGRDTYDPEYDYRIEGSNSYGSPDK
tara:strand:- start:576 stop:986 length:411 start_codon:yes stop_codon:yes gene_type:complete